ncbi:DinB family protein [Chryseosolibacter indicus]|uniref:DinB family protein n=1 Tax=Chryseosolibacter indicus TaxID=2782351 RepID=A0ABS5VQR4_9BACT|nr:DinB family protein [Chryseosolibacter indicus]MBT1703785.1 DinB family protein [Chryseosolibacter indicus]
MNKEVLSEFIKVNADFNNTLNMFEEEQLFMSPQPGSWSAAEVAEHVVLSDQGMYRFITGNSVPTKRKPDAHVNEIREMFLDFSFKMNSPEFIIPKGIFTSKKEIDGNLGEIVAMLTKQIGSIDLTQTCLDIDIPEFKESTRLEIVHFLIVHTQRHHHQLQKIEAIIKAMVKH